MQQFPWVFTSDENIWGPLNVTYPNISDVYQTMNEEDDPVGSSCTNTLSTSNESIETGMNVSNIHDIMVKSVKINQ